MKKKKQEKEIIPCETLEDAEKIVSDKRAAGINPRVIAQTTFLINDQEKRFNIVQISKIQKNNDQNQNNESNSDTAPRNSDKALVFKLFQEGLGPVDVVIKTGMSVEYVEKSYQEYLDFTNQELIAKDDTKWLYKLASRYSKCNDTYQLEMILEECIEKALQYKKLDFQCPICEENIQFSHHHIEWVRDKLNKSWSHEKCSEIYKEF